MMSSIIEVKMGGLEITNNDSVELKTFVGSCVAICLYDQESHIAGMAHVLLPTNNRNKPNTSPEDAGRYADDAIKLIVEGMIAKGANTKRIKAKMAGGATIFSHESQNDTFNIGSRNVSGIKDILKEMKIPLISEDVGLSFGRWVKFQVGTGDMTITSSIRKGEKRI